MSTPNIVRHPTSYNIAARYLLGSLDWVNLHRAERACCE